MPIEPAMHGMMSLITRLGGVAVTGAKVAGRVNAAAFSPATAMNLIPKKGSGKKSGTVQVHRAFWAGALGLKPKRNVGGPPAYMMRMGYEQSRGGQHTASSGRPKTRKSIRGPSAHRRRRSDEEIYRRRRK